MASTETARTAPSGGVAFIWLASGSVLLLVLLSSFRLGFGADIPTLLAANGPRLLLAAAAGGALALSGALRLAGDRVRPWQDLEIFAVASGAAIGGFVLAHGRANGVALAMFAAGALAGASLFYGIVRALDRPRRWTNLALAAALIAFTGGAALAGSYARERRDLVAPAIAWLLGDLSGPGLAGRVFAFVLALVLVVLGTYAAAGGLPSHAGRRESLAWLAFGLGVGCAGPLAFVSVMVPLAVRALARGASAAAVVAASAAAGSATVAAVDAVPRLLVGGYDFPWNVPAGMLAIPGFLTWNLLRLRREAGRASFVREALEIALIVLLTVGAVGLAWSFTGTVRLLT